MAKATVNALKKTGMRTNGDRSIPQQASNCFAAYRVDRERWVFCRLTTGLLAVAVFLFAGTARLPAQPPNFPSNGQHDGFGSDARQGADSPNHQRANSSVTQRLSDSRPITRTGRNASPVSTGSQKTSSGVGSPWKTFGALALVLALIIVGSKLWKKHGPGIAAGLPAEAIDVLGKRHLDARQSIHFVRLGSRILVLGSSAEGLRTLAEVTDPVEVDYLAGLCQQNNSGGNAAQSFRSLFSKHSSEKQKQEAEALLDRSPENEFSITGPPPAHDNAVAQTGLVSGEARV